MKFSKIKNVLFSITAVAAMTSPGAIALTFTDGAFTGNVDITGTIDVPVAVNQWQWASGDPISFPGSLAAQMTNGFKTLTIAAPSDLALLVGQTKAATPGTIAGGLSPNIAFTNGANATVTPVWSAANGKGTITLPVTTTDGVTTLGTIALPVSVGGTTMTATTPIGDRYLFSVAASTTQGMFFGGVPTATSAILPNGDNALAISTRFGATKTKADYLADINTCLGSTGTTMAEDGVISNTSFNTPGYCYAGSYGLGIAQGENIVLNFTNAVSATTNWKAQLKMTVSYI